MELEQTSRLGLILTLGAATLTAAGYLLGYVAGAIIHTVAKAGSWTR